MGHDSPLTDPAPKRVSMRGQIVRQSHDQVFVDWGMAAVNAALTAVQARHAQRVTGQAGDMSVSSARYDTTDEDGGEAITTVSV